MIDPNATTVDVQPSESSPCILEVRLYDSNGTYVIEDQPLIPGHTLPGMLFNVGRTGRDIHIENAYIHGKKH